MLSSPVLGEAGPSRVVDSAGGGLLMLACVGLHIWAMFPDYPGHPATPVISLPHDVAMYVCLDVGWALAAFLVLSRVSVSGGVALGAGLGAVEIGLLVTDVVAGVETGSTSAPGIWLALGGLGAGLAGVLLAASSTSLGTPTAGAARAYLVRRTLTVPVAALVVLAFWFSWQSGQYVTTSGQALAVNGDAFAQSVGPATASVVAGVALGLVVLLSAYWAPASTGAWANVGAVIALTSQLLAAFVQVREPIQDAINGGSLTNLDVARSSIALTADWGIDVAAAVGVLLLAVWAALEARRDRANPALVAGTDGSVADDDEPARESWPAVHRWPGR